VETELQARVARAEARAAEVATRAEQASRDAAALQTARARVMDLETQLAQAGQARARLEKDLGARTAAAEARAAEASRRAEQLAAERREAEARAARAFEEAQARFRDELGRRDQLRAQEVQRLQAGLQERARREKALETELARARGGARSAAQAPAPQDAPEAPDEEKTIVEALPGREGGK
jgi:ParB family chromosome partitioning protein